MPLGQVGLNAIQGMIDAWRARPPVKRKTKPIAVKTATEHIKQLKNFFKWLHRNDDFAWRKPEDFAELVVSVKANQREKAAKLSPLQVKTFSEEELCLLYKYATPLERVLFLLGLNCGFGAAEISTLLIRDVHLFKRHPSDRILGFTSTDEDSFIKRLRPKTDVYGEWLLWPETVQAIQWAMQRRRNQKVVTQGADKRQSNHVHARKRAVPQWGRDTARQANGQWKSLQPNCQSVGSGAVFEDQKRSRGLPFAQLR